MREGSGPGRQLPRPAGSTVPWERAQADTSFDRLPWGPGSLGRRARGAEIPVGPRPLHGGRKGSPGVFSRECTGALLQGPPPLPRSQGGRARRPQPLSCGHVPKRQLMPLTAGRRGIGGRPAGQGAATWFLRRIFSAARSRQRWRRLGGAPQAGGCPPSRTAVALLLAGSPAQRCAALRHPHGCRRRPPSLRPPGGASRWRRRTDPCESSSSLDPGA